MVHDPWSKRVTDLPPNAKLREMQQNTHALVLLIGAATQGGESISPTQGATRSIWCGCGVRQSKEGVENGHGWGMGPKRCLAHPGARPARYCSPLGAVNIAVGLWPDSRDHPAHCACNALWRWGGGDVRAHFVAPLQVYVGLHGSMSTHIVTK